MTTQHTSGSDSLGEIQNQISRIAYGEEYDQLWRDSVAAIRVDEAIRLVLGRDKEIERLARIDELNKLYQNENMYIDWRGTIAGCIKELEELKNEQTDQADCG